MFRNLILLAACLLTACSEKNSWPNPYDGFEHTSKEHGYWRESTSSTTTIGELHLHTEGYSVTYVPFEYRKDYWGSYEWDDADKLNLILKDGNSVPKDFDGDGKMRIDEQGELIIEGINLDGRRPHKTSFKFTRFHPEE